MKIKYEPVFGDQSLFDNASPDAVLVINDMTPCAGTIEFFEDDKLNFETVDVDSRRLKVALRRVIKTPTWTRADQEAGVLPPVGVTVCVYGGSVVSVLAIDEKEGKAVGKYPSGTFEIVDLSDIEPIETPEEKAKRLSEQRKQDWVKKAVALVYATSDSGIETIYDALLSGKLKAPQND